MSLVKKLKDILFEEEEYTEPIKIKPSKENKEENKIVKIESQKDEIVELPPINTTNPTGVSGASRIETRQDRDLNGVSSEREIFKSDNTFQFPDFDEEEFQSSMARPKVNSNAKEMNYSRNSEIKKRNDYRTDYNSRYDKVNEREREDRVNKETGEKKKFKPSPIISPVYGILNEDYKAEDIIKREDVASNINIEEVRKKAFESKPVKEEPKFEPRFEREEFNIENSRIDEPVVTFFEEKDNKNDQKEEYHSIDALLESAAEEIPLEDTLEIPKTNNLDVIEEELEKIDEENKEKKEKDIEISFEDESSEDNDPLDDTLDSDLFELIDSMYDEREEE